MLKVLIKFQKIIGRPRFLFLQQLYNVSSLPPSPFKNVCAVHRTFALERKEDDVLSKRIAAVPTVAAKNIGIFVIVTPSKHNEIRFTFRLKSYEFTLPYNTFTSPPK